MMICEYHKCKYSATWWTCSRCGSHCCQKHQAFISPFVVHCACCGFERQLTDWRKLRIVLFAWLLFFGYVVGLLVLIFLAGCRSLQVDPISDGFVVHVRVPIPVQVERRALMASRDQMLWKHVPYTSVHGAGDNWHFYSLPAAIRYMKGPGVIVLPGIRDRWANGDGDVDLEDIVKAIADASHTAAFRVARICRLCPERCDGIPGYTCPEE